MRSFLKSKDIKIEHDDSHAEGAKDLLRLVRKQLSNDIREFWK